MKDNKSHGQSERQRIIVRTSLFGIGANLLLAAVKAVVGLLSHSIAVVLDAVNNLSDALSSVITIVGAKLSAKRPNKKHPLGYGRIEYISAMLVSALVLYAGITALVESVKKIIAPEKAEYSLLSLLLIAAAVAAKLLLGRYVKAQGKKADSDALVASGSDASFDAILSGSVLLCAILYKATGLSLEAYVGVLIAVFIIRSGVEMMLGTLDDLLGARTDPALSRRIKSLACQEEGVRGAYDLLLNNYGPGRNYATLHIEVPDDTTAERIDRMTRGIQRRVFTETGVIVTGVGIYSYNTGDSESAQLQERVTQAVLAHEGTLQLHGFYADSEAKELRFDVVFSFDADVHKLLDEISAEVQAMVPDYTLLIAPDLDLSE
ncbi:MAG: cation transporter [Oscillospiraceae bacterium]|nr:cation transporter [Oscillospiraceae bacterium]